MQGKDAGQAPQAKPAVMPSVADPREHSGRPEDAAMHPLSPRPAQLPQLGDRNPLPALILRWVREPGDLRMDP